MIVYIFMCLLLLKPKSIIWQIEIYIYLFLFGYNTYLIVILLQPNFLSFSKWIQEWIVGCYIDHGSN